MADGWWERWEGWRRPCESMTLHAGGRRLGSDRRVVQRNTELCLLLGWASRTFAIAATRGVGR